MRVSRGWQRERIGCRARSTVRRAWTKMGPDVRLVSGAKVRVHSLQSAAHAGRNGSFGILGQFILDSERWPVHFETEQGQPSAVLALRAANLEFVAPPQRRRYGPGGAFEWPARVHPNDDLVGLSPTVLKDPHEFTPVPGTEGVVERWGLEIPDQMAMMIRKMQTQSFYDTSFGGGLSCKTPEQQWVELRKEAKRRQIKSRAAMLAAMSDVPPLDMEIRIELFHRFEAGVHVPLSPPIWRELRVSGSTNLGVFQDKILSPVMGWTRNYHGFFFTDYRDGTLWSPIGKSDAIDMMHVHLHVIDALDPFETELRHILAAGGQLGYTYDLGDQFQHLITCKKVLSAAESTGRCTVLAGAMRCPDEDGHGNSCYQEEVLDLLDDDETPNAALSAACQKRSRSMNCTNGRFDPFDFSVDACQAALNAALGSKASAQAGSKKFLHVFDPAAAAASHFNQVELGQKPAPAVEGMEGLVESVNVRPDLRAERLCAACGSPHNLAACAKCRSTFYCSKSCQRADWDSHKRACKAQAEDRAAFKQAKKASKAQDGQQGREGEGTRRSHSSTQTTAGRRL